MTRAAVLSAGDTGCAAASAEPVPSRPSSPPSRQADTWEPPGVDMRAILGLLAMIPGFERDLRLLAPLLRPGQVAIDIGASLGLYSLPMAMIVGRSGAVVAIEPRTDAATRLGRVGRVLGLRSMRVDVCALGASSGAGNLVVPGRRRHLVPSRSFLADPSGGDNALDEGLEPRRVVEVPVRTLDDVRAALDRRVDFVKCDVEGAEFDVFSGASAVLGEDRPVVLCEVEDRHTRRYGRAPADVWALFARYGYERLRAGDSGGGEEQNELLVPTEAAAGWRHRLAVGC